MYNWMKWLRLLGGWHFIAATAIKPPKAACQFAADDILLYKFCYNIQWIYFTIWEKGKEELSPLQYHFKSLHIISRHYKKSLLRSQIYHGYEELSTDTNYPIWRRQKLPYMKKTRKKKQVCGAACFMAAEIKFSEDVRPSVTPFWLCSHHRIIMKFSGVITNDQSKVHAKGQGQRSKVKVTEVTTQLNRFRTVTPVWIHVWWWNYAYSLMLLRRGALLFFKVIRQISRSHGSKNRRIWPRLGVSGLYLQFEFTNGYEMMHKAWSSIEEVPYCFSRSYIKLQGHTAKKIVDFDPNWAFPDCNSSLNSLMATKSCTKLQVA